MSYGGLMGSLAKPDRAQVERDWRTRGFSCGLWTDPPGQVWEGYVHGVDELLMVLEGELELEMQGRTFKSKIGEEVFIPARVTHSVRNVGGTTVRWLYGYKET
jgi:mannose-6-phosphate isomerase-like protein (cupin superfamily)